MTPELIKSLTSSVNGWTLLTPEIMIAGLALMLLVLEMFMPKSLKRFIPAISLACQIGILAGTIIWVLTPEVSGARIQGAVFHGMLKFSPIGNFMRVFFIAVSIIVHALAIISLPKQKVSRVEFFHIVLVITAAMMLLGQVNSFVMLFVALETVTVGFYVLVSYYRTSPFSLEAGLKYLVMGALSSGLLLFGIVLLYGMAGNPQVNPNGFKFDPLRFEAVVNLLISSPTNFVANLGVLLVLSGVAFKIGLVPFQIWIPDVYQGAPTPVTAFLSVGSKLAGFALLFALLPAFIPAYKVMLPFFKVLVFATIIFGNLAALTQYNVKRLMGLSGVAHAGFLMMGVVSSFYVKGAALEPLFLYMIAYALASFAVFGVMTIMGGENDAGQELSDYHGLAKRSPFLAGVLAIALGSLAGIPPMFGFMGKLLIFMTAFQAQLYWMLGVAIAAVVVSIYYYFGWIRAAFFSHWDAEPAAQETEGRPANAISVPWPMGALLAILTLATLVFGVYQKPLMDWLTIMKINK